MVDKTVSDAKAAVTEKLTELAAKPSVAIDKSAVTTVTNAAMKEVTAVLVNATNNEPWYQSRVTWGAIVAVGAGLAGVAGYTFDVEDQAQIVGAILGGISVVGGVISWYGRWRARKPIGS